MKGRTRIFLGVIVAAYFSGIAALTTDCENATVADIVFLVDGSIDKKNFVKVKGFLSSVIKDLNIGWKKVRIGVAQHSDKTHQEFLLKDHVDKRSLMIAVKNMPYQEGGTFQFRTGGTETGKAIDFLRTQYFTEEAGSRAGQRVPQIAVVITDGDSTDDVIAPAQRLRQQGVIVFGIGVGAANLQQLESIANRPPERFRSYISNYAVLQTLKDHLLKTVCISVEDQKQALTDRFADVFFMLDGSMAPGMVPEVISDLVELIDRLHASASTYRIGLAQYGEDTKVEFSLAKFKNKQKIIETVKRFRLRPDTHKPADLGGALINANTHLFTSEAGGRAHQGSRQYLVVMSAKDSKRSVYRDAELIKSSGVTLIGMSAGASMESIESFASPDYAYNTSNLLILEDVILTEKKEIITEDCKGATVADIVFIVDESGSIGNENFRLMRNFLHLVVSSLDVSPKRVRVGIVTYNDVSTPQVFLNSFNNKDELLEYIKILPYNGGGTNTGEALNFTRENVFIKEKGCRKENGVQQVAVVITDGKSQDEVSKAAITLRRAGVTIYALGIKDAMESELLEMASHPPDQHVFTRKSFTELTHLKQTLQKILCKNIIAKAVPRKSETKEVCVKTDEADIFFLMDDSGSITWQDFAEMQNFINKFIEHFQIGPQQVRIGLVKYADSPTDEFDLTTYSDEKSLVNAINSIIGVGGGTETGKALSHMGPLFKRAAATRGHEAPKYLIVVTDGKSTDKVKAPAEELREQGIIIYAIGVKNSSQTELEEIAGDPKRTIFVRNFDALKSINNEIIREICSEEACRDIQDDIFFLTDSSESIDEEEFQKMKDFMKFVISKSAIGENKVHVGVMQFSTSYNLEFPLNQYYSNVDILRAIDDMKQMNEGTSTGKAITEVSRYFDAARGGRPGMSQNLIVITDGKAQDDVRGPAEALRKKGVVIYSIGVKNHNPTQLKEISGYSHRVYSVKDFDALNDLEAQVSSKICERGCKMEKADIIFLVDSSRISQIHYESMQRFMASIVNQTTVGTSLTRFGLISYSDEPRTHFKLNAYDSKRKVLAAIPTVKPEGGGTYTDKALRYSLEYFNAKHGGREVPQILIVITDGAANIPSNLKGPADKLREHGVTVISVGVKEADRDQLLTIAGNTGRSFFVDRFEALGTLHNDMSSVLCNATKRGCKGKQADLIFLLDQSSSINTEDHDMMKNFTASIVNSFTISKDRVRIGLAQFSDKPQDEFDLNSYFREEDLIGHIQNLKYTGGDTFLGKALVHISKYFDDSRVVPKNLVLISDGGSHDDVEDAADYLRIHNISVFAIGVGDIHDLELLQITGNPERLLTVQNFNGLENIKQDLVDILCDDPGPGPDPTPPTPSPRPSSTTPTPPTPSPRPSSTTTTTPPPPPTPTPPPSNCSIDIAMGFDISQRTAGEKLVSGHTMLLRFLPEIVRSVSSVKTLCCVGPDPVQPKIAFQVLDSDGRSLYDTDFEAYSKELVDKVMEVQMSGPTYFKTAMLNSFKQRFLDKSKADVKVLVIFSDGLDEDVKTLEHEAELLRQSGVSTLLTVALEGTRDPAQLQMVEFGRGLEHKLPLSIGMPSVGSTIHKQIDTVSDRKCCNVMCKCLGNEGIRGSRGILGSKGEPGLKGYPGFPGEEGHSGGGGPPGPSGPQGVQGCPGVRGQKGYRGFSGNIGGDGDDGLDGVCGEQGLAGSDGAQGERGDSGNPGIRGIRGEAGVAGQRGLSGDPAERGVDNTSPGAKGNPGNPGPPGLSGVDGGPGVAGDVGFKGADGRRGSVGEKGPPGGPGVRGSKGIPGASGPQGLRGGEGETGEQGTSGSSGPQGGLGPAGGPGLPGRRGATGQKGQPGELGGEGDPGSPGPHGLPGQDGRDGYGPPGQTGAQGAPGFPGNPGLSGEDGQQGTNGFLGMKGNRGRGGNSGGSGGPGTPGEPGHPGHRGPKGPPGLRDKTECQLISLIRDNCECHQGASSCPAFPTELVLGLDMSQDVTPTAFERQRSALLSLLEDVSVSESNCPTGARVAVVGFSAHTKYLIRFQDYRTKTQLLELLRNVALEKTFSRRQLGAAMRFVGQHVFKRVRAGVMMRKVAVFLSNGPSQDVDDIVTATMEYRGLNIVPAVISLKNDNNTAAALEVDDSRSSMFTVLRRTADLMKVKNCAICYDPCQRSQQCSFILDPLAPQEADVDLVLVLDSSREVQADEYSGMQQLLGSVVEQLAVSPTPRRPGSGARVALVQQSGFRAPKVEFGFGTFQTSGQMKRHLMNMTQQGGSSALGVTLNMALTELLLKAAQPRRRRVVLTLVGTSTAPQDRAQLSYVSQKAQCEGVAQFVVTVGERYDRRQVEEVAGGPLLQHLIHLDRLKAEEQSYTQRFFRVFLSALSKGVIKYPPPSLACSELRDPADTQQLNGRLSPQEGPRALSGLQSEVVLQQQAEEMLSLQVRRLRRVRRRGEGERRTR
ncbi:LOW QUALITY PROTEIN: collagen alpha-6(VI) chain-like [Gymnodraco acuticeps]|uniref:LOW QUALITY PROTEIN: collagen alpha-6(VI) chain-like n=1 Tax=Gymnodraco acuticeps TaxID=8218 RepID=A0A6P8T156_GYMAC|nr:LOW QUALITY PROTEIN: collagen alpha-6(VI) chain-like [Gymnodraco acuticeps]